MNALPGAGQTPTPGSCLVEALTPQQQLQVITAIVDSGAGICTISEGLADAEGLDLRPSSSLARLGDGSLVRSKGKALIEFRFLNRGVLDSSTLLYLDAMGHNDSILISRVMLASHGFHFFDSDPDNYGSWIVTPNWYWYRLRIDGGATVCDFQVQVHQNSMTLSPITKLPPIYLDISKSLDTLTGRTTSSNDVTHLAGAQCVDEYFFVEGDTPLGDLISNLCPVTDQDGDTESHLDINSSSSLSRVKGLRKFSRMDLHFIFGHLSDTQLDSLIARNKSIPFDGKKRRKFRCKCSSCLRGYMPFRRVARQKKSIPSSLSIYLNGECWSFDFGRYWMEPDIENYRTDGTFIENNTRYGFVVLMKDHKSLWDAIQALMRFVREKCGVNIVHIHSDCDVMVRHDGSPNETYTQCRVHMSKAGIGMSFSPPHHHALNSLVENFRGRCIHQQNSMLQHSMLAQPLRGRCYLHSALILNVLSVPGSKHPPLLSGATPHDLIHRQPFDYSVFIGPWGSTAHVKNVGTRSSQLVACSDYGIFANVSKDCMAWEVYIPTLQKFVTSTHIVLDTDMSKRLVSIEKCDLLLKNSSAMSHTSKAFADGVRSLYSSHRGVRDDLMVQIDPLSGMPIELVPFVDNHDNNYVMTSSQVDQMTKPSVSNDGSDQPSVSNSDTPVDDVPPAKDVGAAFVNGKLLPQNRHFPLPKAQDLSPAEKLLISKSSNDTILEWNEVNPKQLKSKTRKLYNKYSKCRTLGAYRHLMKNNMTALYWDMARGFVRMKPAPLVDQEVQRAFFNASVAASVDPDPHLSNVHHLSVAQHF